MCVQTSKKQFLIKAMSATLTHSRFLFKSQRALVEYKDLNVTFPIEQMKKISKKWENAYWAWRKGKRNKPNLR